MPETLQHLSKTVEKAVHRFSELSDEIKALRGAREKDAQKIGQLEGKLRKLETVSEKLGEIIKKLESAA